MSRATAKLFAGGQELTSGTDNQITLDNQSYHSDPDDFITVDTTNSKFVINEGGAGVYKLTYNCNVDASQPGDWVGLHVLVNSSDIAGESGVSNEYGTKTNALVSGTCDIVLAEADELTLNITCIPVDVNSRIAFGTNWSSFAISKQD